MGTQGSRQRVPEAAVVVAALLAGSWLTFLLAVEPDRLTEPAFAASVLAVLLFVTYPLLWYAIAHDDEPTTVFPPRAVLAVGIALGLIGGALGVAGQAPWTPLLVVGAVLPPIAYAVTYGDGGFRPSPRTVIATGTAAAVGFGLAAATGLFGTPVAVGSATIIGAGVGAYDRWTGTTRGLGDPVLLVVVAGVAGLVVTGWVLGGADGAGASLITAAAALVGAVGGTKLPAGAR